MTDANAGGSLRDVTRGRGTKRRGETSQAPWPDGEKRNYFIEFSRSLLREDRSELQHRFHLALERYFPTYTYLESIDWPTLQALRAHPLVTAAYPFEPGDNIVQGQYGFGAYAIGARACQAEVRMAPELCTEQGLTLDEVVDAITTGFRRGSEGTGLTIYAILSAMRTAARSLEIAELAVRWRDRGVVGFDIAGAEAGFPPSRHQDAFDYLRGESCHITIHAGEAFGLPSIHEAVAFCGCERLGHGVRIVDDIAVGADGTAHLGRLAQYVRDLRIPLELCPSSNVQTGAAPSIAEHPIGLLSRLRFRVTVNTDNRLMSNTTMTNELAVLAEAFGLNWDDIEWLTINAMKSSFWPFDQRLQIINRQIKPGFARLRAEEDVFSVRPSNQLVAPHGG